MRTLVVCLLAATAALAQTNPLTTSNKETYEGVQKILLRAAEKMPEENYSYKPVDLVRSYGQLVGHMADSQYYFCSLALGEKNPAPKVEKTKTSKADLITALKEAEAYCQRAYSGINDTTAAQTVTLFGNDTPKLSVLIINQMHLLEHYGNMVTYLRMKGLVPPTSEQQTQPGAKK